MSDVSWDDVALQMAVDTGKKADSPSVRAAIEALQQTKLRPSFVLDVWRKQAAQIGSSTADHLQGRSDG